MQLRSFQEPLEAIDQLHNVKELYSYSLESHTLKVIQQLTDGTMLADDLSRINRGRSESVLHRVRQLIRTNLATDRDEFFEMVTDLISQSKNSAKEEPRLASYIRANKDLEIEVGKLRSQVIELRQQPPTQPSNDTRLRTYEKIEELTTQFQRQIQSQQKQLDAKVQGQKDLKRELELMQSRCESEQKKHIKKLKEMEELLNASKREKVHLNGEVKSLNELIRRFEAENTDHIKRSTDAMEEVRKLKAQLGSEKDIKTVEGLKKGSYELKLKDLQAKIEQSQSKSAECEILKAELIEVRSNFDLLNTKLQRKELELKELNCELETIQRQASSKQHSSAKRSRCETEAEYEVPQLKINQYHERQIVCLKQTLREKDTMIAQLNNQLTTNKTANESRVAELQSLNIKLMENLNGESAQLIQHIGKLEQDNTTLVVELKEVVRDYNESLLEAEDKIMFLSQTIKKYEEQLEEVYRTKDALEKDIKVKDSDIEKLRKDNECDFAKWGRDAELAQQQLNELKTENKGLISHFAKTEQRYRKDVELERVKIKQTENKHRELDLQFRQLSEKHKELEQKTKDQHQTIVKLEEKVKLLDESGSKYQQVILDSTARVKQLEGEIQRFSVLAETLKKKFRRKLELILSRIKSSVARLHDQNKALRDYVKSQLKISRTALDKQFKEELSRFQREFARYRQITTAEANIKIEELLREVLLLRSQLARRDEEEIIRREEKRSIKREILGQISSPLNSPKSLEKQLKRNASCNNAKQLRSGIDIEARRTGFEHLKSQIKYEQHRLMSKINGGATPGDFD